MRRALVLLLLIAVAGCATPVSRTGGISLQLQVRTPDRKATLYDVSDRGTLSFGGGMDALDGRFSWSGRMTDGQIEQLRELLGRYRWEDRAPASSGEPRELIRRLTLGGPRGRQRFEVVGDSPEVAELQELLEGIARRRYERYLQTLPKPGPQS